MDFDNGIIIGAAVEVFEVLEDFVAHGFAVNEAEGLDRQR
jgi:hypothetical protein